MPPIVFLNDSTVNKTFGQYSSRAVKPRWHPEEQLARFTADTEIFYTVSASTGTPSHFAAAARSVNSETCSGEWSVNMACNFA